MKTPRIEEMGSLDLCPWQPPATAGICAVRFRFDIAIGHLWRQIAIVADRSATRLRLPVGASPVVRGQVSVTSADV